MKNNNDNELETTFARFVGGLDKLVTKENFEVMEDFDQYYAPGILIRFINMLDKAIKFADLIIEGKCVKQAGEELKQAIWVFKGSGIPKLLDRKQFSLTENQRERLQAILGVVN